MSKWCRRIVRSSIDGAADEEKHYMQRKYHHSAQSLLTVLWQFSWPRKFKYLMVSECSLQRSQNFNTHSYLSSFRQEFNIINSYIFRLLPHRKPPDLPKLYETIWKKRRFFWRITRKPQINFVNSVKSTEWSPLCIKKQI
jgi:hypothetical protein